MHNKSYLSLKIIGLLIFSILILFSINQTGSILIIILFILSIFLTNVGIIIHKDWKSPLVYFPIIFFFYYSIFPIYYNLGGDRILNVTSHKDVDFGLKLAMIYIFGSFVAFVFSSKSKINKHHLNFNNFYIDKSPLLLSYFLMFSFTLLYSYSFIQIYMSGGASKSDRMISNVASFAIFYGGIYFYLLNIIIKNYYRKDKINIKVVIFIILLGLAGYLYQGERDQLVFPLIMIFFIYSYFNKVSIKKTLFIGISIIVILFLLGVYRSYLESGIERDVSSLVSILQENEFISTARNLGAVVNIDKFLYGYTYLGDLLYSLFVKDVAPTGLIWFNTNYYENKGFSLVGEAYINFGIIGVFLLGFLLTYTMLTLYSKSFKSAAFMIAYTILSIAFLYSFRSDLAAITSGYVKKLLIPFLILHILSLLLKPMTKRVKYKITRNRRK